MCAPVFTEQEFTALSTVDAYIRATRDGLAGVAHLFSKDMQVLKEKNDALSQELETSWTKLHAATLELEEMKKVTMTSLLTGRHEEEVSGFQGDVLKELSVVHERARKATRRLVEEFVKNGPVFRKGFVFLADGLMIGCLSAPRPTPLSPLSLSPSPHPCPPSPCPLPPPPATIAPDTPDTPPPPPPPTTIVADAPAPHPRRRSAPDGPTTTAPDAPAASVSRRHAAQAARRPGALPPVAAPPPAARRRSAPCRC
nr:atherin-like [Aegilops tauschii subsp. strangulata]